MATPHWPSHFLKTSSMHIYEVAGRSSMCVCCGLKHDFCSSFELIHVIKFKFIYWWVEVFSFSSYMQAYSLSWQSTTRFLNSHQSIQGVTCTDLYRNTSQYVVKKDLDATLFPRDYSNYIP